MSSNGLWSGSFVETIPDLGNQICQACCKACCKACCEVVSRKLCTTWTMCKLDGNYPILSHHFVDHLNHNIFKDRLIVAHFEVFDFGSFGVTSFSSLQSIDRNLQCMHREARIDVVTPTCTALASVHFFKSLSFLFGGSFSLSPGLSHFKSALCPSCSLSSSYFSLE